MTSRYSSEHWPGICLRLPFPRNHPLSNTISFHYKNLSQSSYEIQQITYSIINKNEHILRNN